LSIDLRNIVVHIELILIDFCGKEKWWEFFGTPCSIEWISNINQKPETQDGGKPGQVSIKLAMSSVMFRAPLDLTFCLWTKNLSMNLLRSQSSLVNFHTCKSKVQPKLGLLLDRNSFSRVIISLGQCLNAFLNRTH